MFDNSSTVVLNNKTVSSIMQGNNILYQKQTSGCTYLIQLNVSGITVLDSQGNPVSVSDDDTFQGVCGETYTFQKNKHADGILTVRTDNEQGHYVVTPMETPSGNIIVIDFEENEQEEDELL